MRSKFFGGQTALATIMACTFLASLSVAAQAAPVTFFGEDPNATGATPIPHPVSDATRTSFLANLTNPGTETFESFAAGSSSVAPNFANGITATLSGGTVNGASSGGRFAISGSNYYNASSANFSINFSSAISAFGFYGTDIGDFGATLSLTLTDIHGATSSLTVPAIGSTGGGQPANGSVLYFGFYDTGDTYSSITFNNTVGSGDVFGFDDFTVGTAAQVVPVSGVPLPSGLPMFGAAIVALGAAGAGYRMKRKSQAAV